jgi:CheY-like chemotaxis protein
MVQTKVVLLVEDNADDIELTLRAFKKNNLLNEIKVAKDGLQAVNYLFGEDGESNSTLNPLPELVLLDLNLPRISGLEVLRRIRENERTKLLPVVILTSSDEEQDRIQSYSLHANSYIRKPVSFNRFTEAIQQLGIYWLVLNEPPPIK